MVTDAPCHHATAQYRKKLNIEWHAGGTKFNLILQISGVQYQIDMFDKFDGKMGRYGRAGPYVVDALRLATTDVRSPPAEQRKPGRGPADAVSTRSFRSP
jgi:hypothetical protein